MKTRQQHPLIIGTLILTATGLISRLIGFFYRIYLSRLFGEEGMGIYQLLSPVLSISFSLTAAGYQTAISKLVAEGAAREKHPSIKSMVAGISISLPLSVLCTGILFLFSEEIATYLLQEVRTAPMLKILAFSIPFSSVHACINGYFYGIKKAAVPASGQLFEQLVRVGCVYLVASHLLSLGKTPSITVAVLGLTIGEIFSLLLAVFCLFPELFKRRACKMLQKIQTIPSHFSASKITDNGKSFPPTNPLHNSLYRNLLSMALPLTANRIVLNFLQSIESVSIPAKLRLYGYDNTTALSVYGVLTGMAMPFIFFPNALTSSIAVLLLPIISEKYALGDVEGVKKATLRTIKYCGLLGLVCMTIFVCFGNWAGSTLFDSPLSGHFIATLGFLCPFLYLDTTLSSILQGLGMAGKIFIMNIVCLLIRLVFVFWVVPHFGISGYLWGLLASQITMGILYLGCLAQFLKKNPNH